MCENKILDLFPCPENEIQRLLVLILKKIQLNFMLFPLMILEIQKFYEHILIKINSDRNLIQIYYDLFNDPIYA